MSFKIYWKGTSAVYICCIFWPEFGCCTPQMLVEVIFSVFCAKKLKKQEICSKKFAARNLQQNFAKTCFFKLAPEPWSTVLFSKNELFLHLECAAPKRWLKYTTYIRFRKSMSANMNENTLQLLSLRKSMHSC